MEDHELEQRAFLTRATVVFLMAAVLILGLLARFVDLQMFKHDIYSTRSDENRILVQPLAPDRGLIYDRWGVLLADNRPILSLAMVVERVADLDAAISDLGSSIDISDTEIAEFKRRIERPRRPYEPVVLKVNLSDDEVARIRVDGHRWSGVEVVPENLRYYPLASLAVHAVGSVRRINEDDLASLDAVSYSGTKFIGRFGVEEFYEQSLHGEVGHHHVEIDVRGRVVEYLPENKVLPVAGQNLTLHLDSRLQTAAYAALGERRGAIVALDPRSGGILALVSNPGYDPNPFITGIPQEEYRLLAASADAPMFNRATRGTYPPGSTFKPIVALAGLSEGVTDWERTIIDTGEFRLPGQSRVYRDWSWTPTNTGGQGVVNLRKAIYRSSNVYFYQLGTRVGIDALGEFAFQFGFGTASALDVETAEGVLPTRTWKKGARGEDWFLGDTVNMSIGQGLMLVTPLQLATSAMVIANRGRWVQPRLLLSSDAVLSGFDTPLPPVRVQGPTEEDWEMLVNSMEDVVHRGNQGFRENGTAWWYVGRDLGYRMAGKSGSAQVVEIAQGEEYDEEELDERQRKHAWFIAFAPADDPRIALSVLVENGGGGSSVAAPVAREVIDAYLLPRFARL
ncbi:MAG: penicillin-binding protein 2 [Gammaproteobacteria bacterium]|nr:penicillin-binding protein 2 [Gammaproteobacteria bacterium]